MRVSNSHEDAGLQWTVERDCRAVVSPQSPHARRLPRPGDRRPSAAGASDGDLSLHFYHTRLDGEGQALLSEVFEAVAQLLGDQLWCLMENGDVVFGHDRKTALDRLANVIQRLLQGIALGDAAGDGGADNAVAAVRLGLEDYSELYGVDS